MRGGFLFKFQIRLFAKINLDVPVLELHGAVSLKVEMHLEGAIPELRLMTDLATEAVSFSDIEILGQLIPVVRVSTLLDNATSAILWCKTTKVGQALLGDYAVKVVLGVVDMRAMRHDAGDTGRVGLAWTA